MDEVWQEYAELVTQELHSRCSALADPLDEICGYALLPPGKLLRPLLCLESANALGADPRIAVSAAAGLELAHVGSLMQDDVIDSGLVRRGRPSVYAAFGVPAAIVSGDALISSLFDALARSDPAVADRDVIRSVRHAAQAICAMCHGQLLEDRLSGGDDCDLDAYQQMIRNKTAAAFRGSCEIGATLAGATAAEVALLGDYGEQLGMAFQIRDDLLPFTESEPDVGKPRADDLANGRPTLPLVLAARALRLPRSAFADCYRNGTFDAVVALVTDSGALERSWDMARGHVACAVQQLFSLPESPSRDRLMSVAHYAMERRV